MYMEIVKLRGILLTMFENYIKRNYEIKIIKIKTWNYLRDVEFVNFSCVILLYHICLIFFPNENPC